MNDVMLIIRSNRSLGEALRLCAAMLGMDETPIITFIESGVHCLIPNAVRDPSILEYLQTVSDIAGIYVLEESLKDQKITLNELDIIFDAAIIDVSEFVNMILDCRIVTTF